MSEQRADVTEFDCLDCGQHVQRFSTFDGEPRRCLECRFIRNESAEHRPALRAQLYTLQQYEFWNAVGCYRDETCTERRCDHCDKPYRGPGVYCCRTCALAEAI